MRGVALVAVLAVLTILALLSMTFAVLTNIEQTTAESGKNYMDALAILDAGLEHAKSLLWYDAVLDPSGVDTLNDVWNTQFTGVAEQRKPEVDVDLIDSNGPEGNGYDAVWIPVRDEGGAMVGRYAVVVEDECSKINVNVASVIPPMKPNEGLSPREIYLGDGRSRGLPFSKDALTRLLKRRYGPNAVPGARIDDNSNNALLMGDSLDNNSDGLIDEMDEGVNEFDEYVPATPYGDDRAIFSMFEAWTAMAPSVRPTTARMALLCNFATLYSEDRGWRWDRADHTWQLRQDLNVASAREVFQTLQKANEEYNFEGNTRGLRRIAANVADYRDENNTLSTVSSEYGVEAVCFNEILANEGSVLRQTYYIQSYREPDVRVFNLAYCYSNPEYSDIDDGGKGTRSTNLYNRELFYDGGGGGGLGVVAFAINTASVERIGTKMRMQLNSTPVKWKGYYDTFMDFRELLRRRSRWTSGDRILWPEHIWKNSYLCVYERKDNGALPDADTKPSGVFQIQDSTYRNPANTLILNTSDMTLEQQQKFMNGDYSLAQIRGWAFEKACYAEFPRVSDWFVFAGLDPRAYYRVYIQETNLLTPDTDSVWGHNMCSTMDVDGTLQRSSEQKIGRLRYKYIDGEAQRADEKGYMDVFVTSAGACSPSRRNRFNAAYFARPDIIELINVSSRPIGLRGWSLVANTGSIAYDLGNLESAELYSSAYGGRVTDPAPVIMPNEYFYLCNNKEIFDIDYGGVRDGEWGGGAREAMPVYEISDDDWGVRFEIKSMRETFSSDEGWTTYVQCGNEQWVQDQFKDEVAEFQRSDRAADGVPETQSNQRSPDGIRSLVGGNTRNTLEFRNLKLKEYSDVQVGDYVMIVGLPRVGGFVSMTLKDQYGQVAARMTSYGNPEDDASRDENRWVGWSYEKSDPTDERWIPTRNPTFGGTVRDCQNHAFRQARRKMARIKNGPLSSVGEVVKVRSAQAWQTIGGGRSRSQVNVLKGVADYFCTAGLRLDPEEEGVHISGWKPCYGECSLSDTSGITDHEAQWQVDDWAGQYVHILSGPNRGETFYVEGNSKNRLQITGRSVPSRKQFFVRSGDKYSLGPDYSSAMFYTSRESDVGEWEWEHKGLKPLRMELHLAGLNDSIVTTEFLEENHNARLDVYLYNYKTREYDQIGQGVQFNKNDVADAGEVLPAHVSPSGGLRLRLVPHGLQGERGSGFAWFDCAYVSPVAQPGRVNINTAPVRVLSALHGIDTELARNIYLGTDDQGRNVLKPYASIADVLEVRGMTPDTFSALANLITVRSDQYSASVLAQRVTDINRDGKFDASGGDEVVATARARVLIDRGDLMTGDEPTVKIVKRERL